jgi:DNA (cytosine-5)-methyltransferase 1
MTDTAGRGMTIGSFCSGYGGLDLAAHELFGASTLWWSEIEPAAQKVMSARFPTATAVGDLTTINPHDLDQVDIFTAGFPCQPFSQAGLRKGNQDERAIFQWIADAIGILRPRYVLMENVQGLLTKGGLDILGALTSVGYDTRWGVVRASDTGAPHKRARWFAIAEPTDADRSSSEAWGDTGQDSQRLRQEPMGHSTSPPNPDSVGAGRGRYGEVPSSSGASQEGSQERQRVWNASRHGSPVDWGKWEPAVRRWEAIRQVEAPPPVVDGKLNHWAVEWMMGLPTGWVCDVIEHRTTALKMLGNGVCPQQAALAYRLLL